jgi:hypothetical protein
MKSRIKKSSKKTDTMSLVGALLPVKQTPEYVGAPQKMWAWGFGFFLAALMFYLVVLNDIRGPVNILTCALCLGL